MYSQWVGRGYSSPLTSVYHTHNSKKNHRVLPCTSGDSRRVWHARSSPTSVFFPNPGLSSCSPSPGEKNTQEQQGGSRRDSLHARAPLCQCWHNWQWCLRLSLCACCVLISSNPFLHRLLVKGNHTFQLSQPDILFPKSLFHSHLHLLQEQQTLVHSLGSRKKNPSKFKPYSLLKSMQEAASPQQMVFRKKGSNLWWFVFFWLFF